MAAHLGVSSEFLGNNGGKSASSSIFNLSCTAAAELFSERERSALMLPFLFSRSQLLERRMSSSFFFLVYRKRRRFNYNFQLAISPLALSDLIGKLTDNRTMGN